jgi:hypothetical protein
MACTSCNNLTRLAKPELKVTCRTIDQGAPQDRTEIWPRRECAQSLVRKWRCTRIPLDATTMSRLIHHSNKNNVEADETCFSRALLVHLFLGVVWKTC